MDKDQNISSEQKSDDINNTDSNQSNEIILNSKPDFLNEASLTAVNKNNSSDEIPSTSSSNTVKINDNFLASDVCNVNLKDISSVSNDCNTNFNENTSKSNVDNVDVIGVPLSYAFNNLDLINVDKNSKTDLIGIPLKCDANNSDCIGTALSSDVNNDSVDAPLSYEFNNLNLNITNEEFSDNNETNLPDIIGSKKKKQSEEIDDPIYQIKWIKFRNKPCPIITQNENGPCPLIAIMNILLLQEKIIFQSSCECISYSKMIQFLGDRILKDRDQVEEPQYKQDLEKNIDDVIDLLPKLQNGLNVNVQFKSITSFEYTSELIIFDLLSISLYHGWIVDEEDVETLSVIGNCSYNQLIDKIITKKSSEKVEDVAEAVIAENFLDKTASQLTYCGLSELASNVREQELSVLFRNNHFITLYKYQGQLYQLVTDQGFLVEPDIVWMTLSHIDNDDIFVNHEFKPISLKSNPVSPTEQKKQIDRDYFVALSIEEEQKKEAEKMKNWNQYKYEFGYNNLDDEELAKKLQKEEESNFERQQMQLKDSQEGESSSSGNQSHKSRNDKRNSSHSQLPSTSSRKYSNLNNSNNDNYSKKQNCTII